MVGTEKSIVAFVVVFICIACSPIKAVPRNTGDCPASFRHRRKLVQEWCCYMNRYEYRTAGTQNERRVKMLECRNRNVANFMDTIVSREVESAYFGQTSLPIDLSSIKTNMFCCLPKLKEFSITMARIGNFPANFFENVESLETLELTWLTTLRELPEDLLSHTTNLRTVHLSGNDINSIPDDFFKNNPELREVRLERNRITHLNQNHFAHNTKLEKLVLSYNPIEYISDGTFDTITSGTVDLQHITGSTFWPHVSKLYCSTAISRYYKCKSLRILRQNIRSYSRYIQSLGYGAE